MKINFESGRSMVEMLGTLAIIGVLSIGGIAGYSYAMDKHRANTIINEVNLRAIDLIAQANRRGEFSLSDWPTKIAGDYDIGLEIDTATNITEGGIFVSGVKKRVCDIIVDSLPEDVDFTVNNTASSTSCTETNKIVFYYNAIDDALGNSTQECAGTIVNGKCEPCEEPLVWDGSACSCPGETVFVSSRNTCEACPSGATYANGTCDCGAKFYYGSSNTCSKIEKPTNATNPN